jgi:putative membrane protein
VEGEDALNKQIKYFLYIIFAVGIAGHVIPAYKSLMLSLTPITLLITSAAVITSFIKEKNSKVFHCLIFFCAITFLIEVVGVKTGLIFGRYVYGNTLGQKVFDVPLIIGINWVLIILGAIGIANRLTKKINVIPLIAASIALVFDIILEPVAIKFNYWTWANSSVPFQNYAAWFFISFFAAIVFVKLKITYETEIPRHYLFVQAVFFMSILLFG